MKTSDFVEEAQSQLDNLKQWLQEIESAIDEETKKLTRLQQQRQQVMDDLTARLLPDLSVASVNKVNHILPDLIDNDWVGDEVNRRKNKIQNRLAEIKESYSPETYDSRIEAMDVPIGKLESDFDDIDKGYKRFLSIPGLADLVNNGYGTPQYKFSWLNAQYYRDWKRADQIVEEFKASNWDDIQSRWQIISSGYEAAKQQLIDAQEQKESLRRLHDEYEALTESARNVRADVLEACRVRLKSELDLRVDKSSDLLRPVVEIDERMQQCSDRINNELQDRRSKVHDQMLAVQQIIATASKSGRREVPDEYAAAFRHRQVSRSHHVNIVNTGWGYQPWFYDDWVIQPTHTNTIIEYFGTPSPGYGNTYNNYSGSQYDHRNDVSESHYGYVS